MTPAAISSSFFFCLTSLLTSASSVRLLMPRISCGVVDEQLFDRQLAPAVDRRRDRSGRYSPCAFCDAMPRRASNSGARSKA